MGAGVDPDGLTAEPPQVSRGVGKILEDQCPIYMSYGMTLEQYWDDDPGMAVYYRKLNSIHMDRINEQLWLQGMYIYDALIRLAPALQAMSSARPEPYPDKPYQIRPQTKDEKKDTEKQQMLEMQAYLDRLILQENESEKTEGGS